MGSGKPRRPAHVELSGLGRTGKGTLRPALSQDPRHMRALEAFLLETLGAHAAAGDWTKRERTEAGEFVDSLMRGNGLPPKTIPKTIEADVKWTFAKGCKKLNIPNNTVVGQQQPWYTTVYNKVRVNK